MIDLGKIEIEKEFDYSYWNPPITTIYVPQGDGLSTGAPIELAKYSSMCTWQVDFGGGVVTSYFISGQTIYSYPAGTLPANATFEVDLDAVYGMDNLITMAVGFKGVESRLCIVNGRAGTERMIILTNDGNFTLINNVFNPSVVNDGLNNVQWDDNTEHWYISNKYTTSSGESRALKVSPDGDVIAILSDPPELDQLQPNCFSFIDSHTAYLTSVSRNQETWRVQKLNLDTFAMEGHYIDVRDTNLGTVPIDISNFGDILITQYIASQNKIVIFAGGTGTFYGEYGIYEVKLIFDPVTETTEWDGEYLWAGGDAGKITYDKPSETMFIAVDFSNVVETKTLKTNSSFKFEPNDIGGVAGKGNFQGYLIDNYYRQIYVWLNTTP